MKSSRNLITAVSLRDEYISAGDYTAKFIIDPRRSSTVTIEEITIVDSDGVPMKSVARRWGTKVHVDFTIDESTADGVSLIYFHLADGRKERFRLWVIQ